EEYIIFFLIWLIPTIIIRTLIKQRSSRSLPPTPRGLPIIGHLHLLSPIPHQALAKLSYKHGEFVRTTNNVISSMIMSQRCSGDGGGEETGSGYCGAHG
ncbi:hypothetical protein MIMGU_mgv1a020561mg, partial [Erythranthe guttata]